MRKAKKESNKNIKPEQNISEQNIDIEKSKKDSYHFFTILMRYLLIGIFIIVILSLLNYLYLENRILWNYSVSNFNFGGLTEEQATKKLDNIKKSYLNQKTNFTIDGNPYSLSLKKIGLNLDSDLQISELFKNGHNGTFINKYLVRTSSVFNNKQFQTYPSINKEILKRTLFGYVNELDSPPKDASISIFNDNFIIEDPKEGLTVDFNKIYQEIYKGAYNLKIPSVEIKTFNAKPEISYEEAVKAKENADILKSKEFTLIDEITDKKFDLKFKDHLDLIRLSNILNAETGKNIIVVDISPTILKEYLENNIASEINKVEQDTVLTINEDLIITADGILSDGYELDIDKNISHLREKLLSEESFQEIKLITDVLPAKIIQPDEINLGITELVGYGSSDYKGSPSNRIHNIKTAMSKFQNIVIMPGEEFSFDKILGAVDASTGYKKELVIKEGGNLTIPEYGGGVCQVSTTIFRAVLYGGFEITDRRSHSYKVVYYNPDGLDATIYPPNVDFKFRNNFDYPILIQNRLEEDKSIANFYIYGTKDNRIVELEGPTRYAYKQKPAEVITQYVPSLPESWRKQTIGHSGFNVYWIRKISREGQEPTEEYFYSYYKPVADKLQLGGYPPPEVASIIE